MLVGSASAHEGGVRVCRVVAGPGPFASLLLGSPADLPPSAGGRLLRLRVRPAPRLLSAELSLRGATVGDARALQRHCFTATGPPGVSAALVIHSGRTRGLIVSPGGKHYLIQPLPSRFFSASGDRPHVLIRLRSGFHTNAYISASENRRPFANTNSTIWTKSPSERYLNAGRQLRRRRALAPMPAPPVHVETAVFVDRDLFQHMTHNFPTDTEQELVRVVLAMINAVQLLYHDPSLGRHVNFVLKRLEILHKDPPGLHRHHNIDTFLSSFCLWQSTQNIGTDSDPFHWDHALILTGLDLYVVSKNGKLSSQVVGLAPVAGMCAPTSSCTVNEGRHFESVYVVAHEIGHNLGMRHDGPLADNDCDPGSYIMSPTLGSGKITWSSCSQRYLEAFLETPQAECLLDYSTASGHLDHNAERTLPGERFDADVQCMLKYGHGSIHAVKQPLEDICRDLHCQRDRYTWTSHPALEGTPCGRNKWCRSGRCITRGLSAIQAGFFGNQQVDGGWSEWSPYSECASGCLLGDDGLLSTGSTGIRVSTRRCNNPRPENGGINCRGNDRRFKTCRAVQCANVQRTTIRDFASEICQRAKEIDNELLGTGFQRMSSDPEEACTVWCYKRNGGSKSRGWTFPDGTICHSWRSRYSKSTYCINGRCEEFICDRFDTAIFSSGPEMCSSSGNRLHARDTPTLPHYKANRRKSEDLIFNRSILWVAASGCHSNCVAPGTGLRLVAAKDNHCLQDTECMKTSIQLCQPDELSCGRLKTPFEYATTVCSKYKERVARLSGLGMQISATAHDMDRPCRVACQDDRVSHRFYLVNGEDGWFPFGTDCARGATERKAFCVSGRCLDFGPDDIPLPEFEYTLPLLSRSKRSSTQNSFRVKSILDHATLKQIISTLNFSGTANASTSPITNTKENFPIDFNNPIHITIKNDGDGEIVNDVII